MAVQAEANAGSTHPVRHVHHMCLPVRNLADARSFWISAIGAEPVPDSQNRLRVADILVDLVETEGGWTGPAAEYPHYGLRYQPEDMAPARDQLRGLGIPTGEIWTRHQVEGLMYFRDPSGNLLETACWHGLQGADRIPLSKQTGGTYATDLEALNYAWNPSARTDRSDLVRPTQLDHLSLPARDMGQTNRFWLSVMGATPGRSPSHMVEIAGIDVSFSPSTGGWTAPDSVFPRYAFSVAPEDLLPLKEHVESFDIPTSDVFTNNGTDASVFLRDPSGNLFELYCEEGFAGPMRRLTSAGGDYQVDVSSLVYDDWKDPR
jgi:catechol 2,3-dioxygenase-like lactoylglutathione lyase family enzyme